MPNRPAAGSHDRRLLRGGHAILLAGVVVAAAMPGIATADHGGAPLGSFLECQEPRDPPRCVSVGDDRRHYVYIDPSVPAPLAQSVRRAMRQAYGPPALRLIEMRRVTPPEPT